MKYLKLYENDVLVELDSTLSKYEFSDKGDIEDVNKIKFNIKNKNKIIRFFQDSSIDFNFIGTVYKDLGYKYERLHFGNEDREIAIDIYCLKDDYYIVVIKFYKDYKYMTYKVDQIGGLLKFLKILFGIVN